jgi:hypothetical protein
MFVYNNLIMLTYYIMSISNILVPNSLEPYFQNINLPDITLDNTQTKLLALNTSNQLNYITTSSLPIPSTIFVAYHLNTSVSIPNSTVTALVYDTVDINNPAITYNNSTGLFTVNTTGYYIITCSTVFITNSTGYRSFVIQNGAGTNVSNIVSVPSTTQETSANNSYVGYFEGGTTFQVLVSQTSGGGLNIIGYATNNVNYCILTALGIII